MFPNSDTEIQSNETNDCTASRRRRVRRLSVALLAAITLVVGITAAGQLSVAEAAGTVVAVDDAGADDEPGQKDLNWLSIDYGSPGATSLTVKWGWDDTATSGANTRDAGSLFDTDGDGFANYSLYVTVATDGSYTTQLYSCSADSRTDRCAGPALVGTFASTATVAVPADSDPFGVPGSADYDAAHVTGNTCRDTTGLLHAGHRRDRRHPARGLRQSGRRILAQRLQLPVGRAELGSLRLRLRAEQRLSHDRQGREPERRHVVPVQRVRAVGVE